MRTDSFVIIPSKEKLWLLTHVEENAAAEVSQRKEMRSTTQSLVDETICVVFVTVYCAATKETKGHFLSFVESVTTEMIYCEVLGETLNQSFNRWSRSDKFMQMFVEKIYDSPNFITPATVIVWQRVISAAEEELKQEP